MALVPPDKLMQLIREQMARPPWPFFSFADFDRYDDLRAQAKRAQRDAEALYNTQLLKRGIRHGTRHHLVPRSGKD